MSNNAITAYANGEKPRSKWTKTDILDEVKQQDPALYTVAKKLTADECRSLFLHYSSWHHTSSHYNRTDFYTVSTGSVTADTIMSVIADRDADRKTAKQEPEEEKAVCEYLIWTGTRRHPKATKHRSEGVIRGNWFYLPDGSKKSIDAKGFKILTKIQ